MSLFQDAACEVSYEAVGCYGENSANRAFNKEIVNEVDPTSSVFNGHVLEFGDNWQNDFSKFLCRCARVTQLKGFSMFGINNHGEAFSDLNGGEWVPFVGFHDRNRQN